MMVTHVGEKHFSRPLRVTALVVVFFFAWTLGGLASLAQAAKLNKAQGSARAESREKAPEERLGSLLEGLETELSDPTADMKTLRQQLKAKREAFEALDTGIRKQFAETEKRLKDAKIPAEILKRHQRFVKHYNDNLQELRGNIDRVEKFKDKKEAKTAIEKIKKHIKRVKTPSKHRPLDPNNLPHRQPNAKKREPRMKKEEFGRDFKKDNHAWRNQKRILVASAGSLAGLLLPDDLAETIEVQFTPEIQAKAAELGNNPVKIYEWVRNNIEYVPT